MQSVRLAVKTKRKRLNYANSYKCTDQNCVAYLFFMLWHTNTNFSHLLFLFKNFNKYKNIKKLFFPIAVNHEQSIIVDIKSREVTENKALLV